MNVEELLKEVELFLEIEFEDDVRQKLADYCGLILEWNQRINLISRKSEYEVLKTGLIESFSLVEILEYCGGEDMIDIGSGGGIPGMIAAIMLPDSNFLLVDSVGKKINVLDDISRRLNLQNVEVRKARLEEISKEYEGKFDTLFTRGVGDHDKLMSHFKKVINDYGTILILSGEDKIKDKVYEDADFNENPYLDGRVIITIEK
ncbi:MAG: 16S rRNA (guanine(527)-N(7))-methyltransferase RsmG [Candidatus Delongbacteria bacterium]|nr:16S rRNA (guanine(527)-N(7))-methyltransferase RsmG [Candidatus Delongbacteria bacterium]MBN2835241.1 16S rRNA (guanine(527)-N(7))-methyltransferase RsmG [Candidatus Delongbacteria bacterium]